MADTDTVYAEENILHQSPHGDTMVIYGVPGWVPTRKQQRAALLGTAAVPALVAALPLPSGRMSVLLLGGVVRQALLQRGIPLPSLRDAVAAHIRDTDPGYADDTVQLLTRDALQDVPPLGSAPAAPPARRRKAK